MNAKEGEAVLSVMFGTVIPYLPNTEDNQKLARLSEEMRINGFEVLMGTLFDSMVNPVMESLGTVLKDVKLPK
jgi:hypothetical protein